MTNFRLHAWVVPTLFGILFLITVDNQVLIPLLPTLGRDFDVSMHRLGWLFSSYALAAALFNLVLGPLFDHFGRVIFIRATLLGFTLIALVTTTVTGYSQFFWLRTATGVMAGALSTCTTSFVGDFFPYARRGRVMGTVLSAYFAALILGVPLGAWIAEYWNWQRIYLFSFLLGVLLFLCSVAFLPGQAPDPTPRSIRSRFLSYPQLLRGRETVSAVLVSFGVSGATLAVLTYISGHLDQTLGIEPVRISWLFLAAGIAAMIGSPVSGWLSDRLTNRKVFLIANTAVVIPLLFLDQLPWGVPLITTFFFISLCIAFRQTALHTLQTELITLERRGSFVALRNSFSQFGISATVLLAGLLYSEFGYLSVTLLAATITLICSALLYQNIQEPGRDK